MVPQLTSDKPNCDSYSVPISTVEFYPDNALNGDRQMTTSKLKSFYVNVSVRDLLDAALSLHITIEQVRKANGLPALRRS